MTCRGGQRAGDPTAQAEPDQRDAARIDFGAAPQPFESGGGVGDEMRAGEVALRAPGPAVVQVENVQADLAKVDGQVEVLLVTGKAVEQQDGGARIVAGGAIETTEEAKPPGTDESGLQPGWRHTRSLKGRRP